MHSQLLSDLVVIFGAALLVSVVSHRLRIPSLVGFLLTGILIGPHGLGLVAESSDIESFAELGVVFLLFVIGLEMSFGDLRRLGRLLLVGGALQTGLTTAGAALVAALLGASWQLAVFIGCVIALSSTAIVLKLYHDRREIEAPHGRAALGILLFQDLWIVPMLLVVPMLAGTTLSAAALVVKVVEGLAVMAAAIALGRWVMPFVLGHVVRSRVRELFVLASLFACLATGLLTQLAGMSMALGAFLAGVALATSDFRHQVLSEIAPLRDVFSSLFFISIGMLFSLPLLGEHFGQILGLTLAILVGKAAVVFLAVRLLGFPTRPALAAALGLCQIGEFSFVLLGAGKASELLDPELFSLLIDASVLTLLATPGLIVLAPRIASLFARAGKSQPEAPATEKPLANHVVIGGFGLNGRHLSQVLAEGNVPYVIADLDGARVAELQAEEEPVIFGDLTRRDVLEAAGIERARIAVFALSDPMSLRQAVHQARHLAPKIHLIARTRQVEEIDELITCGADEVVAEDFETSIEIATRVLERLRLPTNVVRNAARILRFNQYQALRSPAQRSGLSMTLLQVLSAGIVETFQLEPGHPVTGGTIRETELRRATGATILAVLRGSKVIPNPDPDLELEAGDTLVLLGSHAALAAARNKLEGVEPSAEDG